ncbi:hypothetical protein [Sphaerisporangium aureirubrum]|uniref:Uncharacterized protein n=1 Tax=Sphaerisporangium aureirubrum TaxID=1544736 RepID=A0ABW1ND14_9ACTN
MSTEPTPPAEDIPFEARLAGVRPGQVWADADPRNAGRTVRIDSVDSRHAFYTVLTNSTKAQDDIDRGGGHFTDTRGRKSRILLHRMKPTSRGFRLIQDAPEAQRDLLAKLRIPVTTANPDDAYVVAFHGAEPGASPTWPTDDEAYMIASHLEFLLTQRDPCFIPIERAQPPGRPYDLDRARGTVVLHKYGPDDWAYRRSGWAHGHLYLPPSNRQTPQLLVTVLDRTLKDIGEPWPAWQEWKTAHPEVFAAPEAPDAS